VCGEENKHERYMNLVVKWAIPPVLDIFTEEFEYQSFKLPDCNGYPWSKNPYN